MQQLASFQDIWISYDGIMKNRNRWVDLELVVMYVSTLFSVEFVKIEFI